MALDRTFGVADNGLIRPIGGGGTNGDIGSMHLEFNPSIDFQGDFGVMGKTAGVPELVAPFHSIPYRRVTVGGIAADYAIVSDRVTPASIITIPAAGMAIGVHVSCTVGTCRVTGWDLNGPSAP